MIRELRREIVMNMKKRIIAFLSRIHEVGVERVRSSRVLQLRCTEPLFSSLFCLRCSHKQIAHAHECHKNVCRRDDDLVLLLHTNVICDRSGNVLALDHRLCAHRRKQSFGDEHTRIDNVSTSRATHTCSCVFMVQSTRIIRLDKSADN
jgi:hypothetical protein